MKVSLIMLLTIGTFFTSILPMGEPAAMQFLVEKFGFLGLTVLAVWYTAKKLHQQYEAQINSSDKRIEALEDATERCEKDRMSIRKELNDLQRDFTKALQDWLKQSYSTRKTDKGEKSV